jgi:DNA-directed RNA polymerase subunit H (RpoH/RPB5)
MDGLKKIISEELYKSLLMCEVKIQVKDYKKQGYATQIGKMYADVLKKYNPTSVDGYLGLQSESYQELINKFGIKLELLPESMGNYFNIKLENGDVIDVIRNSSPAVAFIFINNKNVATIDNPTELFTNNLADLVNKYYSDYISIENRQEKTYN